MEKKTSRLREVEEHPLEPFFPPGAEILVLGSFPPPKQRWRMNFFYPNFQNDFWRIIGVVFFKDPEYFIVTDKTGRKTFHEAGIRRFLTEKRIALFDAARAVIRRRGNASDQFLEVVRPLDLLETCEKLPDCRRIILTGEKAASTVLAQIAPDLESGDSGEESKGRGSRGSESIRSTRNAKGGVKSLRPGESILWRSVNRPIEIYRVCSPSRDYPLPLLEKAKIYENAFLTPFSDRSSPSDIGPEDGTKNLLKNLPDRRQRRKRSGR